MLDTSAFIMGFDPATSDQAYTVEAVEKELLTGTTAHFRFRLAKDRGMLSVQLPSSRSRLTVDKVAASVGETGFVSEADRDVVALALDLKQSGQSPLIVSDDYAVQNLAEHLHLEYGSLANFGIVHKVQWIMYCPACHRRYEHPARVCRVCGTALRRKVLSKTRVGKDSLRGKIG